MHGINFQIFIFLQSKVCAPQKSVGRPLMFNCFFLNSILNSEKFFGIEQFTDLAFLFTRTRCFTSNNL